MLGESDYLGSAGIARIVPHGYPARRRRSRAGSDARACEAPSRRPRCRCRCTRHPRQPRSRCSPPRRRRRSSQRRSSWRHRRRSGTARGCCCADADRGSSSSGSRDAGSCDRRDSVRDPRSDGRGRPASRGCAAASRAVVAAPGPPPAPHAARKETPLPSAIQESPPRREHPKARVPRKYLQLAAAARC